jgi:hypothetical protein
MRAQSDAASYEALATDVAGAAVAPRQGDRDIRVLGLRAVSGNAGSRRQRCPRSGAPSERQPCGEAPVQGGYILQRAARAVWACRPRAPPAGSWRTSLGKV